MKFQNLHHAYMVLRKEDVHEEKKFVGQYYLLFLSLTAVLNSISFVQTKANKLPVPRPMVSSGFVTRVGTQLMLNGHPFRFAGANMPWLPFGDALLYTPQFQIDDALNTAQEMGLTVVRSHDLGIATGCDICLEPSHRLQSLLSQKY